MVIDIKIIQIEDYHVAEIKLNGKYLKEVYCPNTDIKETMSCIVHSLEAEELI